MNLTDAKIKNQLVIESFSNDYYKSMAVISQGKRFDPKGEYIKEWLPQLVDVPGEHLVDWEKYSSNYSC